VSARLPVEDLEEILDVGHRGRGYGDRRRLLAHQLGKVPIAGSQATVAGLQLTAENLTGRRNRIGTARVQRFGDSGEPGNGDRERAAGAATPASSSGAAGDDRGQAGNGAAIDRRPPD
jgi:magnesium and cobalt exporter, CNNM family